MVLTEMTENSVSLKNWLPTMLSPEDVVNACMSVLDTPPNVLVSQKRGLIRVIGRRPPIKKGLSFIILNPYQ